MRKRSDYSSLSLRCHPDHDGGWLAPGYPLHSGSVVEATGPRPGKYRGTIRRAPGKTRLVAAMALVPFLIGSALAGPNDLDAPASPQSSSQQTKQARDAVTLDPFSVYGEAGNPLIATSSDSLTTGNTSLADIPQTIQVMTKALLVDQNAKSIGDAMRNAPGVAVHQGEGYRDEIVIRGVDTKADFFVNGMRDDGERMRDLYNVKQIDVLQGPAALLFGRGGAGGVVNIITKQPERTRIREMTLEAGSWQRRRATLDIGDAVGETAAFRINLMGEDSNSFREYMNGHRYGINPAMAFKLGDNTSLDLSLSREYDRRFEDRGIPARGNRPALVPRSRVFASETQNFARTLVHSFDGRLEHVFNDSLTLRNTLRVNRLDHFHQNVYPGSDVAPDDTLSLTAYHHRDRRNGFFDQLELIQKLDTGNVHHTILYGLEAGVQVDDNVRFQGGPLPNVPLARPHMDVLIDRPELSNHFIGQSLAGYVQDQIDFSSRWKVLAGVRWEQFLVNAKYYFLPEGTKTRHVDRMLSPSLGAMYALTENTSLYASVTRAFTPAGSSLSLSLRTPDAADLPPEKATNYEIGAKASLGDDRLILTAALFQLEQEHVRARHPVIPDLLVPAGSQRNRGFEIGATGYINRKWSVYAGYAHLDAKIMSSTDLAVAGAQVGLMPKNRVSLWSRYDFNDHWGVGGGWVSQSKVYTTFSNKVVLPGYGKFDGLVYYRWGNYKINLNVNNLFDRHYYATAQGDNQITPGDPRSFSLMFTMNL